MLKYNILVALRLLRRGKGVAFINIIGLVIGLVCFTAIMLYVKDELSFDRYHENSDRIYRVIQVIDGAEESSSLPLPGAPTILGNYPNLVENAVRLHNLQTATMDLTRESPSGEVRRFSEPHVFFTDPSLFDIFDFELLRGDENTVLAAPNEILLTPSMALKYFDVEDPIGKTIRLEAAQSFDLEVVGIIEETPANTHFRYDFLVSMTTLNRLARGGDYMGTNWYWNPAWTYVLLREGVEPEQLEAEFPEFVPKYFPSFITDHTWMYLQPLADIHLHSRLDFEIRPNHDVTYVYIFIGIALFILVIASINFINLTTAQAGRRALEIGVRKVLGAEKAQLVRQFLVETVLPVLIALLLAVPAIIVAVSLMNNATGKNMSFHPLRDPELYIGLLVMALAVGLLSAVYPALLLSSFRPAGTIRGMVGNPTGSAWMRRALVFTQFGLSVFLVAGTIFAFRQITFLKTTDLGFDQEHVVMIPVQFTGLGQNYLTFKSELLENPRVQGVTSMLDIFGMKFQTANYLHEGDTDPRQFPMMNVNSDFARTMGLCLLAGRDFSERRSTDSTRSMIINEAVVRDRGWSSPEDAIGRTVRDNRTWEIVGVVEDFNFASLHKEVGPFYLQHSYSLSANSNNVGRYVAVKIAPDEMAQALVHLDKVWADLIPEIPFTYFFLDESLDEQYTSEAAVGNVASVFSLLAIIVACMGLFGMALFILEQRTKEIGIRKVLGASVPGIVQLLSREMLLVVAAAFLVACPITYFVVKAWLQSFPFHTAMTATPFVYALLVVLGASLLTIGIQSVRRATANPVDCLRVD